MTTVDRFTLPALAWLAICSLSRAAFAEPSSAPAPEPTVEEEPSPAPPPSVQVAAPPPPEPTVPEAASPQMLPSPLTPQPNEQPNRATGTGFNVPERGFLFAVEPSLPDPFHVVLTGGLGNVSRTGEERPVGSGKAFPTLGVEAGLLSRLSVYAEGGVVVIEPGNPGQLASPFILDTGFHILSQTPRAGCGGFHCARATATTSPAHRLATSPPR